MDRTGEDLTKTGRICGIIATAILVLEMVVLIVIAVAIRIYLR